jgi:hypothetical protein
MAECDAWREVAAVAIRAAMPQRRDHRVHETRRDRFPVGAQYPGDSTHLARLLPFRTAASAWQPEFERMLTSEADTGNSCHVNRESAGTGFTV